MPKRWVVGGIWAVLMSAGLLTCIRNAAAEQPTKPGTVQKVTYLGAKHIPEKDLPNITSIRPGTPLNPLQNRQGCQKIMEKYFEQGRWLADCQLLKGGDPADTEVIYQITEGPKVKVSDIQFTGNSFASTSRLRQKIPHSVGGTYNREAVETGINALYTFYRDAGYRDVHIALEIQRDSDPNEVALIYHIHEEQRYRIADDSQQ